MDECVCVLASGSKGNCTYIAADGVSLLIDAGISGKETTRRLEQIGVNPGDLQAICVSHEHTDHTAGIGVLHRRYDIPVFANSGTVAGVSRQKGMGGLPWNIFTTGSPFHIGSLQLEPFSVPHDAYDPVGFIIRSKHYTFGVVTDMGTATEMIRTRLRNCNVLVLEANHDEQMLQDAPRPWSLKQRIRGRQGHLSNTQAASIVEDVAGPGLQQIFLAHISSDCNDPKLAHREIQRCLEKNAHEHINVSCAFPDVVSLVWSSSIT